MIRGDGPREHVLLTVGTDPAADFRITAINPMAFGLEVGVEHAGTSHRILMALAGTRH